jgi:cell wall-associated NlpC family hydrolase
VSGRPARHALLLLTVAATLGGAPGAGAATSATWARSAIGTVLARGAFPGLTQATFQPDALLDRSSLDQLVAAAVPGATPPAGDPAAIVTMGGMHAALVSALGLGPDASALQRALAAAGLRPKGNAGTEVVARMALLTYNHPAGTDELERFPRDPATRAEGAYSAAQAVIATASVPELHIRLAALDAFLASAARPWPAAVVRAVAQIGAPYVWGGESETLPSPYGPQAHGGFDCSGLVWRVFVMVPGGLTPKQIGGRTTMQMAAATPAAKRLTIDQLRAGDQILFGDGRGPATPNGAIGHTAISLGGDWFVHSSSQGVTIEQLAGWYRKAFAFARRLVPGASSRGSTTAPPTAPPTTTPATPPPSTPATPSEPGQSAQLGSTSLAPSPTGDEELTVDWTGPTDVGLSATLQAVPIDRPTATPTILAWGLAASGGSAIVTVPPALLGHVVRLSLVTMHGSTQVGTPSTQLVAVPA